jgi:hypothetical protein
VKRQQFGSKQGLRKKKKFDKRKREKFDGKQSTHVFFRKNENKICFYEDLLKHKKIVLSF